MAGMGAHQSANMKSDVWLTPPELLAKLGVFDLDPCSCDPRPWMTALRHIALPEDGLAAEWHGRVWLNPPYSRDVGVWLERLADHGRGMALVFARTETSWFFDTVWRRAAACLFLEGRLHFHYQSGGRAVANAGAPSVLVAYGDVDARVLEHCGVRGQFVRLW